MSENGPVKKRKRLNEALAEAIGVKKQQENIEKPIALALISDDKSAKNLLEKIRAAHRPKEVLDLTLKVCQQKKDDAVVGDAFLEVFRKYFSILGIDSATKCWMELAEHLRNSESSNEIRICCEFISKSNLLGHGFGKLIDIIKQDIPEIIQKLWDFNRHADSCTLAYSFVCLILAENAYRDERTNAVLPGEFWNSNVLTKSMKKSGEMALLTILANSENEENEKWISKALAKNTGDQRNIEMMVFNHLEFFGNVLESEIFDNIFYELLKDSLQKNELLRLAKRISNVEVSMAKTVWKAVSRVISEIFEDPNGPISQLANNNEDFGSYKDVLKLLGKSENSGKKKKTLEPQIAKLLVFIEKTSGIFGEKVDLAAIMVLLLCVFQQMAIASEDFEGIMKNFLRRDHSLSERFLKQARKVDIGEIDLKQLVNGEQVEKYVNRNGEQVRNTLEDPQTRIVDAIEILRGVHSQEVKKEIYEYIVKFVENIDGARNTDDLRLYKMIVEMYAGTHLESLCIQLVLSRLVVDGWSELDRFRSSEVIQLDETDATPSTTSTSTSIEEPWYEIICHVNELLETMLRLANNSMTKNFAAVFAQIYAQLIRNSQKFLKYTENLVLSKSFDEEQNERRVMRRHKVQQDLARIADGMKRKEGYFSMLTASIIADTIFNGSTTLLTMARLHAVADRNAAALLATNLPAVERTRYKKFLPILTRAAKRVY